MSRAWKKVMRSKSTELGQLPLEWEVNTMEDSLSEIIDYRGKTPKKSDRGIVTLSAKSVKNGYIDYSSAYYISEETYKKFMVRGFPRKGDILLTTEAPLGFVAKLDRDKVGIAQRLLTLRGKDNYLLNNYLRYYLMSPIGQHQLKSRETGTTVTGIKQAEFRKVLISIPPFEEQKAIANILSTLDEKIEANNQINKKLEEMAQTIFKHWFVDFEFPNEDGEPYKSSGGEMVESELGIIPKGWEVKELREIVETKSGYSYRGTDLSESKDAMITIKNFDRNGGYKIDGLKEIIISDRVKEHHYIKINDVIVAHTDLTQGAEIIGNPIMVFSKGEYDKLIMSMDTVKVIPKDKSLDNSVIYFILKSENFKQYALGYVNGTTVLHLSKKAIPQYKIAKPNSIDLFKSLGMILKPIVAMVANNFKENEKISMLRDTILPKLMSGEIRVPLESEGDIS